MQAIDMTQAASAGQVRKSSPVTKGTFLFGHLRSYAGLVAIHRTTGFCETDGERIYYESVGDGEPTLVLCHGAGGNHAVWYQQTPVFGRHRRVISWDHRGFGRSSARGGATRPELAVRDLGAVLGAASVSGPIDLVGQSMGGWTALGFTLAEPVRVRRLVLADTPGGIMTAELVAALRSIGPRPLTATGVLGSHPALGASLVARDPARAYLYQMLGAFGEPELATIAPALFGTLIADERLAALTDRVLFVVGSEDALFPPAAIRASAAKVPGACVIEIPDAGHSPYFEQPEAWNRAVAEFLGIALG
jgi:pimeloyl-ACP methyl ester carboxylesterase